MFSSEWKKLYQEGTHMSVWPWSDLVSFVMRYVNFEEKDYRVLELGCGAGANIPLFVSLGVDYHAIEGSRTIVSKLHKKHRSLQNNIVVGDFTQTLPAGKFDLIVDRASLTLNDMSAITRCLRLCHDRLKLGGRYIGIDWYSTKSSAYREGTQAEDLWTRTNFTNAIFANMGRVHFSDKKHLLHMFADFDILVLEHKTLTREIPENGQEFCTWNFVAEK